MSTKLIKPNPNMEVPRKVNPYSKTLQIDTGLLRIWGLSTRARKAIVRSDIKNFGEFSPVLFARAQYRGCGRKTIEEIEVWIKNTYYRSYFK